MNVCSLIFILLCFARHLCYGLSNNAVERVIGGSDTNISSVPYMLSFRLNDTHVCGAVIINKEWGVTAAHCIIVSEDPLKEITLCSGSSILTNCTVHNIVKFFIHEEYDYWTSDYDIAVIQVTPEFSYNDHTKAVDLPSNNQYMDSGEVCGWGFYRKSHDKVQPVLSKNLKCAVVPRMECPEDYEGLITPRMICYGYQEGGIDTCQNDSGGPITSDDNILLGIISWGIGCAEKNRPGVYIDAIDLQDWIKNNTVISA